MKPVPPPPILPSLPDTAILLALMAIQIGRSVAFFEVAALRFEKLKDDEGRELMHGAQRQIHALLAEFQRGIGK
jgi:hypothetical protein